MSSAINIVLAQRLVRKLCEYCKKPLPIDGNIKVQIDKVVETIFDKSEVPAMPGNIFTAGKCEKCNFTGYKGRIGIYEGIKISEEVNAVIDANPSDTEVEKASSSQGILTMKQDGIIKILKGITSLDELERVVSIED